MIVRWDQDGLPEIQMELKTEHVQATSTSQNHILFILAIGLANGAFKNYNTVDVIFDVRAPRSNRLILEWADHMLRVPIFRDSTPADPFRTFQKRNLPFNSRRAYSSNLSYLRSTFLELRPIVRLLPYLRRLCFN
ncbi:hypothetical protein B0J14DRAFT_606723 [Halenospora varia]|nr:hypothetical protein B0J14DRAFT_606723 [Halenospora varia]